MNAALYKPGVSVKNPGRVLPPITGEDLPQPGSIYRASASHK